MPVASFGDRQENIRVDQLDIKKGEFKGEWIKGGPLQEFSSTGIVDHASRTMLTIRDDFVIIDELRTKKLLGDVEIVGNLQVQNNVHIKGSLEVDTIQTKEIIADKKFDGQYIEFGKKSVRNSHLGTGFLWIGGKYSKQFILKADPDRFYSTEPIDLHDDAGYMINNLTVLSKNELGTSITKSALRQVGVLKDLKVSGRVELGEHVFYDPNLDRFSLGTDKPAGDFAVYNFANDTHTIIDAEDGDAKIGTYNNKNLRLVTDDQCRLKISFRGDVTIGNEGNTQPTHRMYGKLGVNVKNPVEDLEIAGNFKFQNRLFMVGDSAPTKGHWNKGDIVWNENPKNTAPIGWVCTAGGTPGNWSPWGYIGS